MERCGTEGTRDETHGKVQLHIDPTCVSKLGLVIIMYSNGGCRLLQPTIPTNTVCHVLVNVCVALFCAIVYSFTAQFYVYRFGVNDLEI